MASPGTIEAAAAAMTAVYIARWSASVFLARLPACLPRCEVNRDGHFLHFYIRLPMPASTNGAGKLHSTYIRFHNVVVA